MNFLKKKGLLIFIISIVIFSCGERPESIKGYLLAIPKADISVFLDKKMAENPIPGLSFALINDGEIVYRINKGFASLEDSLAVTDQTIFEGASISKPVFAYFVMTFVEEGKLDLDQPLYTIYPHPDLLDDPRHKLLTARMLLSHQGGLPNWREDLEDEKINFIQDPETAYNYSGEGYQYLATVLREIEKTDWKGLEALFQARVAKPLGLQHTGFIQTAEMRKNKAQPYDEDGNLIDWRNNYWFQNDDTVFTAPASLHSEPKEFAIWMISLINETVLEKSSFDALFSPQVEITDSDFPVSQYLGFEKVDFPGTDLLYHAGNNLGFTSAFVLDRSKKWGFVIFSNSEYAEDLSLELFIFLIAGERNGQLLSVVGISTLGILIGLVWLIVLGIRRAMAV
jgi:CubicO group peptidase (beta-lactamase class C family)